VECLQSRIMLQDRSMSMKGLRHVRVIGAGTFGAVRMVEAMESRTRYALKRIRRMEEGIVPFEALREINILNEIGEGEQPFSVRLVRTYESSKSLYILMEYVPGGPLRQHLDRFGDVLNRSQAQFYIGCAILALESLHERNIMHRNINPDSLFLDAQGYVKLGNFGHAKQLECAIARTFTVAGTPSYIAPEIIQGRGYGSEADIWSLGVTLYELVCGWLPFGDPELIESDDQSEVFMYILNGRLDYPSEYKDEVGKTLITGLLQREPGVRLGNQIHGWETVKQDIWFLTHDCGNFFAALLAHELEAPLNISASEIPDDSELLEQVSLSDHEELGGAEPTLRKQLRDIFRKFDINGDGKISGTEFRKVLRRLDYNFYSEEVVEHIINEADSDTDGGIDYEEFISWLLSANGEKMRKALQLPGP